MTSIDPKHDSIEGDTHVEPVEGFFDPALLSELEALAESHAGPDSPLSVSATLRSHLESFLRPARADSADKAVDITEEEFVGLAASSVAERVEGLLAVCRQAEQPGAVQAVESFIIFFQALLPSLQDEAAQREVRRFLFRLAPTLVHIAYNDFSATDDRRQDGRAALASLESVLIEISSVRLTPSESELAFRSIDQMAAFIGVGEYAMATQVISSQLLAIISRNRLMRSLFRLMEVEVDVQRYLKEKLGYLTPQITVPEDLVRLDDYGPIRVLQEAEPGAEPRYLVQVQIPDIPILRDVVLHLARADGSASFDLRMDALGSAPIDVPPGVYSIGLVYEPQTT